jgi:hypothetical protein
MNELDDYARNVNDAFTSIQSLDINVVGVLPCALADCHS